MRENQGFFRTISRILAIALVLSILPGPALGTEDVSTLPTEMQTEPTIPEETVEAEPECPAFSIFCEGQPEPGHLLTFSAEPAVEGLIYSVCLDGGEWMPLDSNVWIVPDGEPGTHTLRITAAAAGWAAANVLEITYTIAPREMTPSVTMTPEGGSFFLKGQPLSIALTCDAEDAQIFYASSFDGEAYGDFQPYSDPLTVNPGFGCLYLKAYAQKEGCLPSEEIVRCFTEQASKGPGIYFGQLHGHSLYSDGLLSPEVLYARAAETMDFFAITDHSNSLDPNRWSLGNQAAQAALRWDFVGLYGYEMTWPEETQLGHLNVFGTWDYVSRDQYPDTRTALSQFYSDLASQSGAIGQFNHPGTTYGTFRNFSHYSEAADAAISLLELGPGMDLRCYIQALDKGWHIAPTCNQDYHGQWQDDGRRTAVSAGSLTEAGLYEAISGCRVYATEDPDFSVSFSLEGYPMGSRLKKTAVGETVTLSVFTADPTDSDSAAVEVITSGGTVLWEGALSAGAASVTLPADQDYYFLRITQSDGDRAVTAPVWLEGDLDAGISYFGADTQTPLQGTPFQLTLELYNKEPVELQISGITCSVQGEVLYSTTQLSRVAPGGSAALSFPVTWNGSGSTAVEVTVTGTLNGEPQVYQASVDLAFRQSVSAKRILVDGTHQNAGLSYIQNLPYFTPDSTMDVLAAGTEITAEMLNSASVLVVGAPGIPFEAEFLTLVAQFVSSGGTLVVCGQSDRLDSQTLHTSWELNRLLAAAGVSLRFQDNEARDSLYHGNSETDLELTDYNPATNWSPRLHQNEPYRQSMGCTVTGGTWLVRGFSSTYAADADGDGLGGTGSGLAVVLACEDTPYGGTIFAAGGVFYAKLPGESVTGGSSGGNRKPSKTPSATEDSELPLSTIAEACEPGEIYRIRGYVTAGTGLACNRFTNTVYIQDATGGIALMPFGTAGLEVGTPLEVTGCLDLQNGNRVLGIFQYETLSAQPYSYAPLAISPAEAEARLGMLVQVEGEVTEATATADGLGISSFVIADPEGNSITILIEDQIASASTGENRLATQVKQGNVVRAAGIAYVHTDGSVVIRVRNCDEVSYVMPEPYNPRPISLPGGDEDGLLLQGLLIAALLTAAIVLHLKKERER